MFIAEDGTGIDGANSLASVEFADSYFAERNNITWSTFSLDKKQALLIGATDYIVDNYRTALLGYPVSSSQSLPFPRYIAGINIGLPIGVQKATAELAYASNSTPLYSVVKRGKKRVKVGPIEVEYDGNSSTAPMFVSANLKMAPFLTAGSLNSNQARLIRV